jgi:hypothetical protein
VVTLGESLAEKGQELTEKNNQDSSLKGETEQEATNPFLKLIQHLHEESPQFKERTQQALDWYRNKLGDEVEGEINPLETYETRRRALLRFPGQLITFKYDPKYKRSLPYYDQYPLVLTLDVGDTQGFLGLNFHYLRPIERAIFMAALYKYQTTRYFQPIIKVRYDQLLSSDSLRYFRPCIKRYLYKQMSPNMAIIGPHLWDVSIFLPSEKFLSVTNEESFTKKKVWEKSSSMYRKRRVKRKK